MRHIERSAALLPILVLLLARPADGHAILLQSTPSPNQAVSGKSIPIEFHFNSRVDGRRSRLRLVYSDGQQRDLAIEQPSHDSLASRATDLPPGVYVIHWQILAEDGHITRGDVMFRVK